MALPRKISRTVWLESLSLSLIRLVLRWTPWSSGAWKYWLSLQLTLIAALSDGRATEEDAETDEHQQQERYPEVHPAHQEALHIIVLVLSTNVTNLRLDHHVVLQTHLFSAFGRQMHFGVVHILQQVTAVTNLLNGEKWIG